jgi:uncharacterized membrane protein YkvI
MAKRKTSDSTIRVPAALGMHLRNLLAKTNRGLLLDIFIFVANLFLLQLLTRLFIDLFQQVSPENPLAKLSLGVVFLSMWILPALGAVLKRWSFHQRLKSEGKVFDSDHSQLSGCLFNPIFYFCLNLVITAAVLTSLGDFLFGKALLNNVALFVPVVIAGLVLTIVQTYFIYNYFSPPTKPPRNKYLLSPQSEMLGDVCLFLNMILFQVMWNMLTFAPLGRPSSVLEFGGRLFVLCFLALLIYFPPRLFYLAEDIHRRRTWLTMLLANSPVIVRVLFGTGEGWH